MWDGKDFIAHRKTSPSFIVTNRRLTVSLMLQPLILEQMLAKNDGISRQSGFLARSLMAYPASAMGERFYQEPPKTLAILSAFHERLKACLDESIGLDQSGCHEIPCLSFSDPAKAVWVQFFNHAEAGLAKTSQWSSIKDFASKAAENVARLSALFHLFLGKKGRVTPESVEQAIQIIQWHLFEARRILDTNPQPDDQDAIKLLHWLKDKALRQTTPRYLQQYGPIREKTRRDNAIFTLIENYYLKEVKSDNKTILLVNPLTSQM